MSLEMLARLTAHGINPAAVSGRSSTGDGLSSAEIAGLLSGLNEVEMTFCQAKYMGDEASVNCLLIMTLRQTEDLSKRLKWKVRPTQLQALSKIAVKEAIAPCKCKNCNGVGHKSNKACRTCGGSGFGHESVRSMALVIGVDEAAFRRYWKQKLSLVQSMLYDIDHNVFFRVYYNNHLTTSAF
ncbi:MAG: hypothetical protein WCL60_01260 [Methylococcales bacterium]